MSIEIQPILPKFLGIKHFKNIPERLIKQYTNYIMDLDMVRESPSYYYTKEQYLLRNNPILNKIKKNILIAAKEYLNYINFECNNIQLSNSWAYVSKPNPNDNPQNLHQHYNSLISGVFYLTEGTPLWFYESPTKDFMFKQPSDFPSDKLVATNINSYKIEPKKGLLILFPSNLSHFVATEANPSPNAKNRISIAFNIIPKGEFGSPYAQLYL